MSIHSIRDSNRVVPWFLCINGKCCIVKEEGKLLTQESSFFFFIACRCAIKCIGPAFIMLYAFIMYIGQPSTMTVTVFPVYRLFQCSYLPQPKGSTGIAWHSPVTTRGQADGTDFYTIRKAIPLKLLAKETTVKRLHGVYDSLSFFCPKGDAGKLQNFCWSITVSQHMIEKEIMIVIGADGILRYLCNFSIILWRQQLR